MEKTTRRHYVNFISPGTFVNEESDRPVDEWDVKTALKLSKQIKERHGATPFAFYFETFLVAEPIDDGEGGTLKVQPKLLAKSGRHFIGGEVFSVDAVRARAKEDERILLSNMECNCMTFVIENRNSYRSTQPFEVDDVVVDPKTGKINKRGDEPELVERRARHKAERDARYAAVK